MSVEIDFKHFIRSEDLPMEAPYLCLSAKLGLYEECENRIYFKYLNTLGYFLFGNRRIYIYHFEEPFNSANIPQKGIAITTLIYHSDTVDINTRFLPVKHILKAETQTTSTQNSGDAPYLCWGQAKKEKYGRRVYGCENAIKFKKLIALGSDTRANDLIGVYYYEEPNVDVIPQKGIVIEHAQIVKTTKTEREVLISLEFVPFSPFS